ncbi:membrane protein, partial [Candidatus Thiomargarita nelsonii]
MDGMTNSSANDLINDNKRRRHLTIFFFVAAIILAIFLNWGQLFAPEIWPFVLTIGLFLVALLRFCLVKLKTHHFALHELDKGLSPAIFSQLHQKLLKKEKKQFIADNLSIFNGVLNKSMPFFVQQRLKDVILRLERCQGNFENSFHLMNSSSVPIAEETSWRFLGQFFVNTLLFIGIIGTFHGLIIAFSDEKIIALLNHYGNQDIFNQKLKEVFAGFYEAFGSSLIAYISYIFGRVMLEMVDTDHDALGQFLEQRLMGDFVTIFPKPSPQIELPEEVKIILEKSAHSLDKLTYSQKDLVDKFEKTVNRYQKVSEGILKALLEG